MKNIAVFFGGKSCESEVSVLTAFSFLPALKNRYNVFMVYRYNGCFYCDKKTSVFDEIKAFSVKKHKKVYFENGFMYVKNNPFSKKKIDCALVCAHGGEGENGVLSGILEGADIPYTCSMPAQSGLCLDKAICKRFLRGMRIPVLPWIELKSVENVEKVEQLGYPVIVKPSRLGSSIGIAVASDKEELNDALSKAFALDNKVLVERALQIFREYTCAVFRVNGEIVFSDIEEVKNIGAYYDFNEKYDGNSKVIRDYPAKIDKKTAEKIYRYVGLIYDSLDLSGVVRVDFLEEKNRLYVNEINTVPGSLAWYLFKNKGYYSDTFADALIDESCKNFLENKSLQTVFPCDLLGKTDAESLFCGQKDDYKK